MRSGDYPVYAPPLIIEILSPSNPSEEIDRKRVAAFCCGTREFWLIHPEQQTIQVSIPGAVTRTYKPGDEVPVYVLPDAALPVNRLFQE